MPEVQRAHRHRHAFRARVNLPVRNGEFAAPAVACDPDLVEPRFCALPEQVMRQLQSKGRRLDAISADRAVWNRLAA